MEGGPVLRYTNYSVPFNASDLQNFFENPWRTSTALTFFLVVSYCTVMAMGLLGNICLIYVIARQKEKANVTNILIANLSFSDIMVCTFCLPFTVVYTLMDHWIFGEVFCKMTPFIQCMSVTVSILSLVMIALERHQLIINPTGWKPSVSQAYLAVVIIWMLGCLVSLPFVAFHILTDELYKNLFIFNTSLADKAICAESWPSRKEKLVYTTWLLVVQYGAPLAFIAVCYIRIYMRLRKRRDMMDRRSEDNRRLTNSRRINMMLVSLVVAFGLCWLPLNVFNTIVDWDLEVVLHNQHNLIFSLCHLAAMSSTCVNPIIYGFLNNNFKNEVKSIILRCKCRSADEDYDHFPLSTVTTDVSKASLRLNCRNNSV
ncbi:neuropeptide Y receptor type 1-like [Callorhinchus milii]|uniref:Neuropeptide Y receptor Y4 n=1 Tax=Callorhinchus milii TaxID=7868 RepID=C0J0A8_CALMI|nr:neuropeptide Y receptor type 1-like [Callorhinchus milii]ACF22974.1 neuropeptide Y receptor Y4 [Callorhinchus milii]|eukprot:gi/632936637/ref/XP_007895578.1/ PREDICTED: neuropeptide Y receptor type 1-like [Callorhinchus milii]